MCLAPVCCRPRFVQIEGCSFRIRLWTQLPSTSTGQPAAQSPPQAEHQRQLQMTGSPKVSVYAGVTPVAVDSDVDDGGGRASLTGSGQVNHRPICGEVGDGARKDVGEIWTPQLRHGVSSALSFKPDRNRIGNWLCKNIGLGPLPTSQSDWGEGTGVARRAGAFKVAMCITPPAGRQGSATGLWVGRLRSAAARICT